MTDDPESNDTDAPIAAKRRWPVWVIAAGVLVLVAGGAAAFVLGSQDEGGKLPCGQQAPTGVKAPHAKATDHPDWLRVVDSGMRKFTRSYWDLDQSVDVGVIVKNTSRFVLYDATVDIQILDGNGKDVTRKVSTPQLHDNSNRLRNQTLPLVFPGQEVGLGNDATVWESVVTDSDTHKSRHPKPLNYDDLRVNVKLKSGAWWAPRNDVHIFDKASIKHVRLIEDSQPVTDIHYPHGPKAIGVTAEYRVKSAACRNTTGYLPSAVVYDDKGHIIGGYSSGRDGEGKKTDEYSPGRNAPLDIDGLVVPDQKVTVKMFPYMSPTTPKLHK